MSDNDPNSSGSRDLPENGAPGAKAVQPDGASLKHAGVLSPSDKPVVEEAPDGEVAGTLDSRG